MSLVNVGDDSWLSELAALERLSQEIQQQITERDSLSSIAGEHFLISFVYRKIK